MTSDKPNALDDPLYKLPTTEEIAKQGVAAYVLLLERSQNAKELFTSSVDIRTLATHGVHEFVVRVKNLSPQAQPSYTRCFDVQRCFTGISAEIAFQALDIAAFPRTLFVQTQHDLDEMEENFFLYHKERTAIYDWEYYHLFHLPAVRHVARNYPAYFPAEVVTETKAWLQNNWTLWTDGRGVNGIRYGLLSGFPLEATLKFSSYKQATQKLKRGEGYLITEEERHLLQTAQGMRSHVTWLSYFGFHAEKDKQYIQQLDTLFLQSGIRER